MGYCIIRFIIILLALITRALCAEDENDLATTCFPLDRALDVLVILDGSGSVGGGTFDTQLLMLRKIVDAVEIGPEKTKLAVLQYSGYTKVEFNFNEYTAKEDLKQAIERIHYISGTTRTGRALRKAAETFSVTQGARVNRKDVAQIVVVVTDGHSQDDPVPAAEALRKSGVTVLAVGIGEYVNMGELLEIAVDSSKTFKNDSLNKFDETFRKIAVGEVCTYAKGNNGAEILCQHDSIQINVLTRHPFEGHLYIKGHFNDPACSVHAAVTKAKNSTSVSLRVPITGCGIEEQFSFDPRGMVFESTAIIMFNADYNTQRDKAFDVRCFYPDMRFGGPNITEVDRIKSKGKFLPAKDDPKSKHRSTDINEIISFHAPQMQPPCVYSIRKVSGCISEGVAVGEKLIHQWECENGKMKEDYAMLVHSCYIYGGRGQKRLVLDEDGCPIDLTVMSTPAYTGQMLIQMETTAVKFADTPTIKFKCSLKFCNTRTSDCSEVLEPRDCSSDDDGFTNRTKRMAAPASAQGLPREILDRAKMRQKFMLDPDFENGADRNASDRRPIVFPPMAHFTFSANSTELVNNSSVTKTVSRGELSNRTVTNVHEESAEWSSNDHATTSNVVSVEQASGEAIKVPSTNSTSLKPIKMDEENLKRLWQAAVNGAVVPPAVNNETADVSVAVLPKINNSSTSNEEEQKRFELSPPDLDELEDPEKFQISGLSQQILKNFKYDQILLDSPLIVVHDVVDSDSFNPGACPTSR